MTNAGWCALFIHCVVKIVKRLLKLRKRSKVSTQSKQIDDLQQRGEACALPTALLVVHSHEDPHQMFSSTQLHKSFTPFYILLLRR